MQIIRSQGSVACMVHGAAPAPDIGGCLRNGDHIDRRPHVASAIASTVMLGCEGAKLLMLCVKLGDDNVGLCASSYVRTDP